MEQIKDAVRQVMASWETKIKPGAPSVDAPDALLKKLLTKKEFGHIKFRYLRKGIMGITTDSSPWLYYFGLHKEELLTKVRKHMSAIKDIRFYVGEIR
jgi:hypothetical protein